MQTCPNCHASQLDGAIFCSECGASFLTRPSAKETTAALRQRQPEQPRVVAAPLVQARVGRSIMLVVLNSGRRMILDTGEDILIGRKDNARGIFPDVDLGLDGGYDAGVSRRHAIISFQQGACVLQDLNSANGTFINATRIDPHVSFPLHDGDELTFGTLILRIEFH